jgi:hypothetical protein
VAKMHFWPSRKKTCSSFSFPFIKEETGYCVPSIKEKPGSFVLHPSKLQRWGPIASVCLQKRQMDYFSRQKVENKINFTLNMSLILVGIWILQDLDKISLLSLNALTKALIGLLLLFPLH